MRLLEMLKSIGDLACANTTRRGFFWAIGYLSAAAAAEAADLKNPFGNQWIWDVKVPEVVPVDQPDLRRLRQSLEELCMTGELGSSTIANLIYIDGAHNIMIMPDLETLAEKPNAPGQKYIEFDYKQDGKTHRISIFDGQPDPREYMKSGKGDKKVLITDQDKYQTDRIDRRADGVVILDRDQQMELSLGEEADQIFSGVVDCVRHVISEKHLNKLLGAMQDGTAYTEGDADRWEYKIDGLRYILKRRSSALTEDSSIPLSGVHGGLQLIVLDRAGHTLFQTADLDLQEILHAAHKESEPTYTRDDLSYNRKILVEALTDYAKGEDTRYWDCTQGATQHRDNCSFRTLWTMSGIRHKFDDSYSLSLYMHIRNKEPKSGELRDELYHIRLSGDERKIKGRVFFHSPYHHMAGTKIDSFENLIPGSIVKDIVQQYLDRQQP